MGRQIYEKYYELVKGNFAETIFPDEVETEQEYSEGKTRLIKVNSYERNQLARQQCIEHYGLNKYSTSSILVRHHDIMTSLNVVWLS